LSLIEGELSHGEHRLERSTDHHETEMAGREPPGHLQ
jgi:hypothetical protein